MDKETRVDIVAACHCKRNRFTTTAHRSQLPLEVPICHCYQCRHVSGNLCISDAEWPNWPDTPVDLSSLVSYDFSPNVLTHFCPDCGTNMFYEKHTEPRQLTVYVGAIEDASDVIKFTKHEWLSDTRDGGAADWIHSIDHEELPRFTCSHRTTEAEQRSKLTKDESAGSVRGSLELDAKCLCEGVQFKISRPNVSITPGHTNSSNQAAQRYIGSICVCKDCRLSTGTVLLTLAYVPIANIRQESGEQWNMSFGTLKQYRGSDRATRCFCSTCGAFVFYIDDAAMASKGFVGIGAGLLCADSGAQANDWLLWRTWKISWEDGANHKPLAASLSHGLKAWGSSRYQTNPRFLSDADLLAVRTQLTQQQ